VSKSSWPGPTVINRRNATYLVGRGSDYEVNIGRPSKWGNPFVIGKHGTRDEVCEQYERWLATQPQLIAALDELTGKDLVCWCAPLRCHGDLLLRLANHPRLRAEWAGVAQERPSGAGGSGDE
jgi:hypothetical protein